MQKLMSLVMQKQAAAPERQLEAQRPSPANLSSSSIATYEKPVISCETLLELREACAQIVRETGPSEKELDAIDNAPDPLERYQRETAKTKVPRQSAPSSDRPPQIQTAKPARYKEQQARSGSISVRHPSSNRDPSRNHRTPDVASVKPTS